MPVKINSLARSRRRVRRWIVVAVVVVIVAAVFHGPLYRLIAVRGDQKALYSACRDYLDADRAVCEVAEGDSTLTLWGVIDSTERRLALQERDMLTVFVELSEGSLSAEGRELWSRISERQHPEESARLRAVLHKLLPTLDENKRGHKKLWHEGAQLLTTLDKLDQLWSVLQKMKS